MRTVLVTPRSLSNGQDPALRALEAAGFRLRLGPAGRMPDEAELLALVPGCAGWIAGIEPVSEAVLAAAPGLRVISRNGVGVDNLPLEACARLGITVRRAEGANAQGVAELAIALMLAGLRQLAFGDAGLKHGLWQRRLGRELAGSVVGIVGLGSVGRRVAALALGFEARVLAFDPVAPQTAIARAGLDAVLTEADIVSLHCPPMANGQPMIDRSVLARMRPGAVLVNTARASLVDQAAVLAALEAGHLSCYATDVFEVEPPGQTALILSDRVIATPHVGGYTSQSVAEASRVAVVNLLDCLKADHAQPAQ